LKKLKKQVYRKLFIWCDYVRVYVVNIDNLSYKK